MAFRWRQGEGGTTLPSDPGVAADRGTACPSLVKALGRVFRAERPRILDLGSQCGPTAVALAGRGARVTVDSVVPPKPLPRGDDVETPPPFRLAHDDASFDLVVAWELLDFVPPERLDEVGGELVRLIAADGWLLLFARSPGRDGDREPEALPHYRMTDDERLIREPGAGPRHPRWTHPTRAIETALKPLRMQGIHLQRNQLREFLALRA